MIVNVLGELGRVGEQRGFSTVTERREEPKRAGECGSCRGGETLGGATAGWAVRRSGPAQVPAGDRPS